MAAATGAFRPVVDAGLNRNDQLQPPSSFLLPVATRTNATAADVGVTQRLPWFGTTYNVAWNAGHTTGNSFLNSYNPIVQSGLSANVSQPLLRNLHIDDARQRLVTSRIDRAIAGTAAAGSRRAHDGRRQDRVLEPRDGHRERGGAPVGARPRGGTRPREQGQGGHRAVAAARPGGSTGGGRLGPGATDHRGDRGEAGRGPAADPDLRHEQPPGVEPRDCPGGPAPGGTGPARF